MEKSNSLALFDDNQKQIITVTNIQQCFNLARFEILKTGYELLREKYKNYNFDSIYSNREIISGVHKNGRFKVYLFDKIVNNNNNNNNEITTKKVIVKIKAVYDNNMALNEKLQILYYFFQELYIMNYLQSKGNCRQIVNLSEGFVTKDNRIILEIDYCSKGSLFDYIYSTKEPLSLKVLQKWFKEMLQGLEFCHKHRIIHQDIKLPNFLLTDDLSIKLADFDNSIIVPIENQDDYVNHSYEVNPSWQKSIEIIIGMNYTYSVDIYSLACCFLEMIVKEKTPFRKEKFEDQLNIMNELFGPIDEWYFNNNRNPNLVNSPTTDSIGIYELFPEVPQSLRNLLWNMFSLDQNKRIKASMALWDPFFKMEFE